MTSFRRHMHIYGIPVGQRGVPHGAWGVDLQGARGRTSIGRAGEAWTGLKGTTTSAAETILAVSKMKVAESANLYNAVAACWQISLG